MNGNGSPQLVAMRVLFGSFLLAFCVFFGYVAWVSQHFGFSFLASLLLIVGGVLIAAVFKFYYMNRPTDQ